MNKDNLSINILPGEKQVEELGANLAAEMMFYAVASAVLANEVDILRKAHIKKEITYCFSPQIAHLVLISDLRMTCQIWRNKFC